MNDPQDQQKKPLQEPKYYVISHEVAQALVDWLGTHPFNQVVHFVQALSTMPTVDVFLQHKLIATRAKAKEEEKEEPVNKRGRSRGKPS